MVKLSLSSTKGTGARYFPHAGYLALTPLKVEGIVRTRLDDDRKPLLASDIVVAVRCYEARIGRSGITHSNLLVDHHTVLWSKPPQEAWAEVSDGDWPFRLVLPPKLAGHSTAHFQEYRVFWRVEAVLNHVPMTGVGHRQVKTYDLPLMRYDAGEALPVAPSVWAHAGGLKHAGSSSLRYAINTPPFPLGPMDLVPVALKLSPGDSRTSVHAIALAVERRLEFHNPPFGARGLVEDTSMSSTTNLIDRAPPSPKGSSSSTKMATFLVTSAEASDVPRDETGVYARTITLQIPEQKSSSHWAVGETMRTALVSLRFFLRVKVTLGTGDGTFETVDLAERELCLISSNESQRRVAMSKYREAVERARTRDMTRLPSPPPSPTDGTGPMTASSLHGPGSAKGKSVRRPHTSAGPRDSAREVARSGSRRAAQSFREVRQRASRGSTHTSSVSSTEREGGEEAEHVRAWEDELERIEARSHWRTVVATPAGGGSPTVRSAPAVKTKFASPTSWTSPSFPSPPSSAASSKHLAPAPPLMGHARAESVQAWEEELERIAAQSRRRSVEMLGFNAERRTRPRIDVAGAGSKPY